MPTYEITAPDGRTFEVTGPNKERALAALKAQLAQEQPQQAQTDAPDTSLRWCRKVRLGTKPRVWQVKASKVW